MLNFKKYKSESDGNVAMMFAVTSLMLLTGIGGAIDFAGVSHAKNSLQSQVEAGVLAAALVEVERTKGGTRSAELSTREQAAREVIADNVYDFTVVDPVLTLNRTSVTLEAEFNYRPQFAAILGIDNIRLKAEAESGLPGADGVDIALVLDNTMSMEVSGETAP